MQLYRLRVLLSEFPSQYRHKFWTDVLHVSAHEISHPRLVEPPLQL